MKVEEFMEYQVKSKNNDYDYFMKHTEGLTSDVKLLIYSLRNEDPYVSYFEYRKFIKKERVYTLIKLYLYIQFIMIIVGLLMFLSDMSSVSVAY